MNNFVMNTKEYKSVINYGNCVKWTPMEYSNNESGYLSEQDSHLMEIRFSGCKQNSSDLFKKMHQICEEL